MCHTAPHPAYRREGHKLEEIPACIPVKVRGANVVLTTPAVLLPHPTRHVPINRAAHGHGGMVAGVPRTVMRERPDVLVPEFFA